MTFVEKIFFGLAALEFVLVLVLVLVVETTAKSRTRTIKIEDLWLLDTKFSTEQLP